MSEILGAPDLNQKYRGDGTKVPGDAAALSLATGVIGESPSAVVADSWLLTYCQE